jgi:hypothetical protein
MPRVSTGVIGLVLLIHASFASGQPRTASTTTPYDIGTPALAELYVSPTGDDGAAGTSASAPLRTLTAAWARVPVTTAATGVRINLMAGTYPCEPGPEDANCINYFSDRHGSYQAPVIVRGFDGPNTVTLRGGLNIAAVDYLYLIDLTLVGGASLPTNSSGNNLLHLEEGHHVLLRGLTLQGPACASDACNNLQEVLKVNQSQSLYVEDSLFSGAWHTVVDYFSVQYGHFRNNRLNTAGQWCMYVKGGTSYLRVEANEFVGCQLGFQAGQAANLAVMRSPWVQYEAYDIKFVNNVLREIPGVGFSAAGVYNALFAYNTLYRVGTAVEPGYALAQFVHGERGCQPTDEVPNAVAVCTALVGQGAWGPTFEVESTAVVSNRNVYVYNNILYNPSPAQTRYSHLDVQGPLSRPTGFQNSPNPARTDDNLVLRGNIIWNGPVDHPLGAGDDGAGCQASNPTCNPTQLRADNAINTIEPQLGSDLRPTIGSNVFGVAAYAIPAFTWDTFTPAVPSGTATNTVPYDRVGASRPTPGPAGAYMAPLPPFTDHPLVPRASIVKAVHITELRQRIDELRVQFGLDVYSWTDAVVTPRVTRVRALHLTELRAALDQAYLAAGLAPPSYSPSGIAGGITVITAAQIGELRAAVIAIW